MLPKKWCCILALCFLTNMALAQQVTVNWSDKIKSASGISDGGIYIKSIPGENEELIAAFGMRSKKAEVSLFNTDRNFFPNIKLIKFNKNLEPTNELEFEFPINGKKGYLDLVKLNNSYYLLSYSIDKSAATMTIEYEQVNPLKLTAVGASKTLATLSLADYDKSNKIQASDLSIDYSPDSTKILFAYEPDLKKKDNKEVVLVWADENMKLINNLKHNFNELYKKVRLNDASIDNEGKIYLSYNLYEKDFDNDYIKSDGDKIPGFTTNLCIINGAEKNIYAFESGGKFIHESGIAYDENRKVCIVGLYKERYNGRIVGAFKGSIDEKRKVIGSPAIFQAIPQDILDKADVDDMGKKDGKKMGLDNDFHIRYSISISPEGRIYLLSEFNDIKSNSYTSTETWGDILVTTFFPNSKTAAFTLISKKQISTFSGESNYKYRQQFGYKYIGFSFEPILFNGKLFIFYNDDEDNMKRDPAKRPEMMANAKKSMLIAAEIALNGLSAKKMEILSHRDYDGYITTMHFSTINENMYAVFALASGMFKYGVKIGTLTIK